jgi:hypothetical protein
MKVIFLAKQAPESSFRNQIGEAFKEEMMR